MKTERIQELERQILHHKELYYRGKAEISDEAYDKLESELKRLDPENPVLDLVGHMQVDEGAKVSHQKKMLSLNKTYDFKELISWMGKESVLSILKIDGSSCSLIYKDGHLQMAKTRGDGQYGENITKKAMFITNIPKSIPCKDEIEIRGEVFCEENDFFHLSTEMESLGLERPSSQRNIVAGILGRKENIYLASYLKFKAFDLIGATKYSQESKKLDEIKKMGFSSPEYEIHKSEKDIEARIQEAKDFMAQGEYLVDGLVFVFNENKLHTELGETAHHPKYKMAFKFQGDTKVTEIKSIEWGVSRNGILTPVANVVPVDLSGAQISRVTLHNLGLVENFELKAGDKIEIIRSGEVIPKFLSVYEKAKGKTVIPHNCPSCDSKLVKQDIWLLCENENCPAKIKEEILNYIKKAGVDDVSDKRLDEMISKKLIKHTWDLYKLQVEDFLKLDKAKDKLATKMYENIQKSKQQTLAQFISAIGVEGVSQTKCEKIIAHGYNSIDKVLNLTSEQMISIEGFAEKSSNTFLESLKRKKPLIKQLLASGVNFIAGDEVDDNGPLKDLKFCITGELSMPRPEFEKLIKKHGGIMVSSVSKNTSFLVTNEMDSTSSKFIKAKSLGIPIITEDQLLQKVEG